MYSLIILHASEQGDAISAGCGGERMIDRMSDRREGGGEDTGDVHLDVDVLVWV